MASPPGGNDRTYVIKVRVAVCVDNSEHPASREVYKIYRVVPDQDAERDGDLRIIDESGEDYLCPGRYFLGTDLHRKPKASRRSLAAGPDDRVV